MECHEPITKRNITTRTITHIFFGLKNAADSRDYRFLWLMIATNLDENVSTWFDKIGNYVEKTQSSQLITSLTWKFEEWFFQFYITNLINEEHKAKAENIFDVCLATSYSLLQ